MDSLLKKLITLGLCIPLVCLVFEGGAGAASSKDDDDDDDDSAEVELTHAGGGPFLRYGWLPLSDARQALGEDLPTPRSTITIIGGKGYSQVGQWLMGGGGAALIGGASSDEFSRSRRGGGYGGFYLQRLLWESGEMAAALGGLVGAGGGGVTVTGEDGTHWSMTQSFLVMDPTLSILFRVSPWLRLELEGSFFIPLTLSTKSTLPSKKEGNVFDAGPTVGVSFVFGR